jgi:hypothetical protein
MTSNRSTATATTVTRPKTETYRNLLRAAPPPTKFAFWYDDLLVDGNYISRWGIKHGLNVLYASCYVALKYVGPHHYNTVGRLLQSCLLPYYGLQPNLAASVAHQFLSTATATDIQIGTLLWNVVVCVWLLCVWLLCVWLLWNVVVCVWLLCVWLLWVWLLWVLL